MQLAFALFCLIFICMCIFTVFLYYRGPYLWREFSPAVVAVDGVLFLLVLIAFALAWRSDPGIYLKGNTAYLHGG